jgi:hypothetical protein
MMERGARWPGWPSRCHVPHIAASLAFGDAHLGDRVGLAVVAELGGCRAVGGVGSDGLGGVAHNGGIAIGGYCGGREGKDGGRELQLHVDGLLSIEGIMFCCSRRAVGSDGVDGWMDGCRVMEMRR